MARSLGLAICERRICRAGQCAVCDGWHGGRGFGFTLAQSAAYFARLQRASRDYARTRAWALWLLADFADRAGDAHAAEAQLRGAMEADPQNEGIRSALSDLLLSRGAYREALALDICRRPPLACWPDAPARSNCFMILRRSKKPLTDR